MSERDELIEILWQTATDDRVRSGVDLHKTPVVRAKAEVTAEAILAAGYSKPRTVTTVEELDALPVGSVLIDGDGDICQRLRTGWRAVIDERCGNPWLTDTLEVDLPATVLHEARP
ncbi:hypothetical protein [Arthrobacter sp. ISL-69]|uniref:hypothetical protein n=1 Tax=Arthrobacter sp. ISL-69 TaxID=2819113 RepID=UPI001BE69317|nr:hypothetical protein [Arthrobacter sp. ISL-69]MBT2537232.1 hypothetical protein [Arthrobacter sp. ISL-69]